MSLSRERRDSTIMTQTLPIEQMTLLEIESQPSIQPSPFLKWVGGKTQLLKQFEHLFPSTFDKYYEPFVGSGAVFFHLLPTKVLLSDANPNLIAAYQHIQLHVDELLSILYVLRSNYHALSPQEQEQDYYKVRDLYNQLPSGFIEKTAYLIFLNKTGYNGLYRESKRGGYNVPFGRYDNPMLFSEANLRAASSALRDATLLNADFSVAVEDAREGDFVYFDPPYVPLSKTSSFTSYTKGEFTFEQQTKLAQVIHQLADKGVQVMLSNSNSDFIRERYKDLYIHEVKASRAINSKASLRGKISELVVTSYKV